VTSIPRPRLLAAIALLAAALAPAAYAEAKPGALDRTFGRGAGFITLGPEPFVHLVRPAVAQHRDGRIGVAGTSTIVGSMFPIDPTGVVYLVGPDGRLTQGPELLGSFRVQDIAFQPDGKLLVAGAVGDPARFAVARVRVDGRLDSAYSDDGTYVSVAGAATEIAIGPDGSAIVVGGGGGPGMARVERIGPDGSPLDSYEVDVGSEAIPLAVALQPDGRIVVAGGGGSSDPLLMRLTPALAPDPGFAPDLGELESLMDVAVQSDGRMVLATRQPPGAGAEPVRMLARLLSNGGVDPSFNAFTSEGVAIEELATDPAGRIVFAGSALGRALSNGSLDRSFASGGISGSAQYATDLARQPDGKILVGLEGNYLGLRVSRFLGKKQRCGGRPATYIGSSSSETIRGGVGRDVIAALGGNDRVMGFKGRDIICGGRGRDRIFGGAGNDRLLGGAGRDVLRGGKEADVLQGGKGRDSEKQ
jgi:uncharacterized delta-60 repeat protein